MKTLSTPKLDVRNLKNEIRSYVMMTIGLLMFSFGWTALLIPAQITGGGAGGIGAIIYYATSNAAGVGGIPVGLSFLLINVILLAIGFWILGPRFGAKTIYAVIFTSVSLGVMQEIIPLDLMGLSSDKLLSAILGGGFAGVGVGMCLSVGGSSGGTDIIAMIINKYRNMSLGKLIMLIDIVIASSSYIIFHDLPSVIYGYVTIVTLGYAIDAVLSGSKSSSQIMVFSSEYETIAERVIHEVNRGVTILDATGAYSKTHKKVLLVVCRRSEASLICRIIKDIDSRAFITQASVMGVFGEGFDALRTK